MNINYAWLTKNWKTSLNGLCGLAIAIILSIVTLPPKAGAGVVAVAGLRAVIGFLQKDAGKSDGLDVEK